MFLNFNYSHFQLSVIVCFWVNPVLLRLAAFADFLFYLCHALFLWERVGRKQLITIGAGFLPFFVRQLTDRHTFPG
jgi:hypothetical protein